MQQIAGFITDLLVGEGIFIGVTAFVVAEIIKTSFDFIPKKYIPFIGGMLGIVMGMTIPDVFPDTSLIVCAVKGLTLGWAATGAFEAFKGGSRK